jgi:hypothetical protein
VSFASLHLAPQKVTCMFHFSDYELLWNAIYPKVPGLYEILPVSREKEQIKTDLKALKSRKENGAPKFVI